MENRRDRSDYLTANRALIEQLVTGIDDLIQRADSRFKLVQGYGENAPRFIESQDAEYNQSDLSLAAIGINVAQTMATMLDTVDRETAGLPEDESSMIEYDVAEYSATNIYDRLRVDHTVLKGVFGINVKEVEGISISRVSDDGLLRSNLMAIFANHEPIKIYMEYQPVEDDYLAALQEAAGNQYTSELHALIILGIRGHEEFAVNLQRFEQQLIADGKTSDEIILIVDGINSRVTSIKEDTKFRSMTNLNEPSVDELQEIISVLNNN